MIQYDLILSSTDPPEIELETDRVHSGENKEAHLTCLIHGNPTPTVGLFKIKLLDNLHVEIFKLLLFELSYSCLQGECKYISSLKSFAFLIVTHLYSTK